MGVEDPVDKELESVGVVVVGSGVGGGGVAGGAFCCSGCFFSWGRCIPGSWVVFFSPCLVWSPRVSQVGVGVGMLPGFDGFVVGRTHFCGVGAGGVRFLGR